MHSIWARLSAIFSFTLTCMAFVTVAIFLSTINANRTAPVSISVDNARVRSVGRHDHALVSFSISADVSPVFNWNVKQLFMYLVAEYKTPQNAVNQIVLWDSIIHRSERVVLNEQFVPAKYHFLDDGQGLKGNNVTLSLRWNIIPTAGHLAQAAGTGSFEFRIPDEYVSGRIS